MKAKKLILKILFIIFLVLFLYSFYKIIDWKISNKNNRKINETLHEYINIDKNNKYTIDFDKLKEKNPDTAAYIKVNNTNIDYVIVKGEDNKYYLNHNFDKENNMHGWIFMDHNNKLDGEDRNIVIYGHNTVNKSMFGSLKNILESSWYNNEKNYSILFITPDSFDTYQVFSTYKIDNEDYYINTKFSSDEEYLKFLNKIKSRSIHNYNVNLDSSDKILTLSTCSNNGKKRVVLHAKKIVK